MLYRLHTQNKRKKWICQLVSEHFAGFTIVEQAGYWKGKKEHSLCIEIVSDRPSDGVHVNKICRAICAYNNQDCVLVQKIDCEVSFINEAS